MRHLAEARVAPGWCGAREIGPGFGVRGCWGWPDLPGLHARHHRDRSEVDPVLTELLRAQPSRHTAHQRQATRSIRSVVWQASPPPIAPTLQRGAGRIYLPLPLHPRSERHREPVLRMNEYVLAYSCSSMDYPYGLQL